MCARGAETGTTRLEHTATGRARRTSRPSPRNAEDCDTPDLCGDGSDCDKRNAGRAEKEPAALKKPPAGATGNANYARCNGRNCDRVATAARAVEPSAGYCAVPLPKDMGDQRSNAVLSGRWPAAVGMIEAYPQRSAWTHSWAAAYEKTKGARM
jgi:hypothetical protein